MFYVTYNCLTPSHIRGLVSFCHYRQLPLQIWAGQSKWHVVNSSSSTLFSLCLHVTKTWKPKEQTRTRTHAHPQTHRDMPDVRKHSKSLHNKSRAVAAVVGPQRKQCCSVSPPLTLLLLQRRPTVFGFVCLWFPWRCEGLFFWNRLNGLISPDLSFFLTLFPVH